jgi:hypothetical protein
MLVMLAAGAVAAGPACRGLEVVSLSDWRDAVQSHFKFVPQLVRAAEPALPPSFPILTPGASPDTVEMAPVEVRAKPIFGELTTAFIQQDTDAKNAEIHRKLGIGFKGVHAGPIQVGFVTVFYVPVLFLGGMSW